MVASCFFCRHVGLAVSCNRESYEESKHRHTVTRIMANVTPKALGGFDSPSPVVQQPDLASIGHDLAERRQLAAQGSLPL